MHFKKPAIATALCLLGCSVHAATTIFFKSGQVATIVASGSTYETRGGFAGAH